MYGRIMQKLGANLRIPWDGQCLQNNQSLIHDCRGDLKMIGRVRYRLSDIVGFEEDYLRCNT